MSRPHDHEAPVGAGAQGMETPLMGWRSKAALSLTLLPPLLTDTRGGQLMSKPALRNQSRGNTTEVHLLKKHFPQFRLQDRVPGRRSGGLLTQFPDKWHELLVLAQRKDGAFEWCYYGRETEELEEREKHKCVSS